MITSQLLSSVSLDRELFRDYLAIIGIDLEEERRSKRKSATRFCYIRWLESRNQWVSSNSNYALSNADLARNLAGEAIFGIRAGKNIPLTWVDLDIDRANFRFDDPRLTSLIDFVGAENCLIQLRASGNFSVLVRCKPLKPREHQRLWSKVMEHCGIEVKSGNLEIFPAVDRGRRLPFADQFVFAPVNVENLGEFDRWGWEFRFDQWKLEAGEPLSAVAGDWRAFKWLPFPIRSKAEQIKRFRELRPIDTHHELRKLAPIRTERPSTIERRSVPIERRSMPIGDDETADVFTCSIGTVLSSGLRAKGTRHFAETRLIRHCYGLGLTEAKAEQEIGNWYKDGKTFDKSKEWQSNQGKVLGNLRLHVKSFYSWLSANFVGNHPAKNAELTSRDALEIINLCGWQGGECGCEELHFAEWLYDLLLWTKARQKYKDNLFLSAGIMRGFRNGRDFNNKWLPKLVAQGILVCENKRYKPLNYSRIWRVNWNFSRSGKVIPRSWSFREALMTFTTADEIQALFKSRSTAWRLNGWREKVRAVALKFLRIPSQSRQRELEREENAPTNEETVVARILLDRGG